MLNGRIVSSNNSSEENRIRENPSIVPPSHLFPLTLHPWLSQKKWHQNCSLCPVTAVIILQQPLPSFHNSLHCYRCRQNHLHLPFYCLLAGRSWKTHWKSSKRRSSLLHICLDTLLRPSSRRNLTAIQHRVNHGEVLITFTMFIACFIIIISVYFP